MSNSSKLFKPRIGKGSSKSGKSAKSSSSAPRRSSRKPKSGRSLRLIPGFRSSLSVIISARDEEETLFQVLKQVMRLRPVEIIVVLNGCKDRSFQRARLCKQAVVVHCPESAGHDVGRAIGAKLSRGDILLFLDGDMVIPAPQLISFPAAIDRGGDVALNDIDPLLPNFAHWDEVTRCKLFLNSVLGRTDLGTSSITAVPHALSRRAVETIGCQYLMVPPKAHAVAIMEKLKVEKAGTVNVINQNRQRKANTGEGNAMARLISGDHAEALHEVLARGGSKGLEGSNGAESRRQTAVWRNGI
ncbi:glycosyltransferase family 2 protein [Paenibacillus wynnii]|uniref:glycosyltransferase family 2 protein n=1 Tax=Paenibacillus wynnii TaxID=268407 RepID=UPI000A06DBE0|nr:glycosyltransferase family A protein [Paenibacillus wynnii]